MGVLRAADTTQQTEGLRLRRGAKPQVVQKYDKAKQRRIKGCVSGSKATGRPTVLKWGGLLRVRLLINQPDADGKQRGMLNGFAVLVDLLP